MGLDSPHHAAAAVAVVVADVAGTWLLDSVRKARHGRRILVSSLVVAVAPARMYPALENLIEDQ